ncbi:SPOR domain-containing protein, partial [Desulfobacterales bacterium HSG16]|nr:SPOR domain-containing protein [Desulfobacterales bacterium HSG16]
RQDSILSFFLPPMIKKFASGILVLFLCTWCFGLGVWVGRRNVTVEAPIADIQDKLVSLKDADIEQQKKKFKKDARDFSGKQPELGFHESLKKNGRTFRHEMPHADTESDADRKYPEKKPSVQKNRLSEKKSTETDLAGSRNAGLEKASNTSQDELPDEKKKLTIQVASFQDPSDANRLLEELEGKGYNAYVAIGSVKGKGIWYRVRVGYYERRVHARPVIKRLKKAKYRPFLMNVDTSH